MWFQVCVRAGSQHSERKGPWNCVSLFPSWIKPVHSCDCTLKCKWSASRATSFTFHHREPVMMLIFQQLYLILEIHRSLTDTKWNSNTKKLCFSNKCPKERLNSSLWPVLHLWLCASLSAPAKENPLWTLSDPCCPDGLSEMTFMINSQSRTGHRWNIVRNGRSGSVWKGTAW